MLVNRKDSSSQTAHPGRMKRAGRIRIRPREQGLSAVSASKPGNLHACILDLHANVAVSIHGRPIRRLSFSRCDAGSYG